jgi:hypothetical protein
VDRKDVEDAVSPSVSSGAPFATTMSYLSWDHRHLDHALTAAREHVDRDHLAAARLAVEEYARGLERHLRIEEELVFPVFEARTGMSGGPTALMREEHRAMRVALAMMRDGVGRGDPEGFRAGLRFLHTILPEHNAKEHVLYPTVDRLLTPAERAAFTARLARG